MSLVNRARKYLEKIPGAVEGQQGDVKTFYVAATLVNDFNLSTEEALPILNEWNQKCQPPWKAEDLSIKLKNAKNYSTRLQGTKVKTENKKAAEDLQPIPLFYEIPDPEDFPFEALGPFLGDVGLKLYQSIQAPDAICGQSVLSAAALAVQGYRDIIIDGRVIPLSLFCVSIAKSGERKSSVDSQALHPFRTFTKKLSKKFFQDKERYTVKKQAYDLALKKVKADSKDRPIEQIEQAILNLGSPPAPPFQPLILLSEPTFPGLYKLLERGHPSVGIFTDEAGLFIGGHGMNTENQLAMSAGLSKLWEAKPLERVRVEGGASSLVGKRTSMHLSGQPEVLQILLNNSLICSQGLNNRILIAFPKSMAGKRQYQQINLDQEPSIIEYRKRVLDILNQPLPIEDGTLNELSPPTMSLSDEAKDFWIEYQSKIEFEMGEKKMFSSIKGFASKIPEQTLRIAGVLELYESKNAKLISKKNIVNASKLTDFYLKETLRLSDSVLIEKELLEAKKLLDWVKGEGGLVYSSKIATHGPPYSRVKRNREKLIKILQDHRWIIPSKTQVVIDGKIRKKSWCLNKS